MFASIRHKNMKIAFDAKRAYQNTTGLGHYSRTLITSLATSFPQHQYFLCAPKVTNLFNASAFTNVQTIAPVNFPSTKLRAVWRGNWVKKDLLSRGVDLYHGLSHEIPSGIHKTNIKSVVTIHDLIFERYPKQYNPIDVLIYRKKFSYACKHANRVIAISQQTKDDIIRFYKTPADKIDICYQSCNPSFAVQVSEVEKKRVKELYNLPDQFFLYVGSIIERKNLLNICKAYNELKGVLNTPLVVIGNGGKYKQQVVEYCKHNNLLHLIYFLSDQPAAVENGFKTAADFPGIYQQALAVIYPSIFEGFGIPVLEALSSKVPVITSNLSCLPETGGDAAYYIDPYSPVDIANAMVQVENDESLRNEMIEKGWSHAQKFTPEACAANVMQVYLRTL
jgi:glycosyltransferase involved in cell wall biosynthesis